MQDEKIQAVPEDNIVKYTIKDSVFSDLFKIKKYLMQLYKALHPEDEAATEDELTDITIKNVLNLNDLILRDSFIRMNGGVFYSFFRRA